MVLANLLFRDALRWRLVAFIGLVVASGCETPPPRLPAARPARKPAPAVYVATAQDSIPPTPAQRGYHRYRGTLDGRQVQLELTVTATTTPYAYAAGSADVNGFFRFLDTGKALGIGTPQGFPASRPLETEGWANPMTQTGWEAFCTDQPVGPVLTGTYALGGRWVPFRVQENYSDCLRYEILTEETQGPPETWHEETRSSSVKRDYLHLLGADTLQPVHARIQCPLPAQRERVRTALAKRTNSGTYLQRFFDVRLNEANLLAYELQDREEWLGSRNYEATIHQVLYDLRTGRALNLMSQLRPGGQRQLHQLLIRQAMADTAYARHRDHWRPNGGPLPLPAGGFAVTPEGLVAGYAEHESEPEMYGYSQTIVWATLGPLLRPNSPLHRLIRAHHKKPNTALNQAKNQ